MWAKIDNNNIVIGYSINIEDLEEQEKKDMTFIKMTPENSPAYMNGYWDGKKFHKDRRS
jgi:hypothetical protein